jgi:hypothetical protein
VFGVSTVPNASGVFGAHNNAGTGMTGLSVKGDGMRGITHTSAKCGVVGINDDTAAAPTGTPAGNGVFGDSRVPNASGVLGGHNGGGYGVSGVTNSPLAPADVGGNANDPRIHAGVWGHNNGRGYGVKGTAQIIGIYGVASQIGVMAQGEIGLAALGDRTGVSASGSDAGVSGSSPNRGVSGFADTCGVFGNCNPADMTHPVVDVSGAHGMGVLGVGVDAGARGLSRDGAGVVGISLTGTGVGAVTLGTGQNANAIFASCPKPSAVSTSTHTSTDNPTAQAHTTDSHHRSKPRVQTASAKKWRSFAPRVRAFAVNGEDDAARRLSSFQPRASGLRRRWFTKPSNSR